MSTLNKPNDILQKAAHRFTFKIMTTETERAETTTMEHGNTKYIDALIGEENVKSTPEICGISSTTFIRRIGN